MSIPQLLTKDPHGWSIWEGSRVRVQPKPINGCTIVPRSYFARVVGSAEDERGMILLVRAEKNWNLHATRPDQCKVVKPGRSERAMLATARLRGELRRRKKA